MNRLVPATLVVLLLANLLAAQYCTPNIGAFNGGCQSLSYFSPTVVGSITYAGAGQQYDDQTALATTVTAGGTLSVSTTLYHNSTISMAPVVECWVDWDQNHVFDPPEHTNLLLSPEIYGIVYSAAATIAVPLTAAPGITRLRLRFGYYLQQSPSQYSPSLPCGNTPCGQVQDFSVVVVGAGLPPYQVNQPGASFTVGGQVGTPFSIATVSTTADNICSFGVTTVDFSSTNTSQPWDLGVTLAPVVPGSGPGFATAHGQLANINLNDPTFLFLNGGGFNVAFPGNFSVAFAPGAPYVAAAQLLVLDAAQPDGFSLSQPSNYACTPALAAPAVEASWLYFPYVNTDAAQTVDLADPALCLSTGAFSFYGTTYTQVTMSENGRLLFGVAGGGDFSPTVTGTPTGSQASADSGAPFVGVWCDFAPWNYQPYPYPNSTHITLSAPASGIVQLAYTGITYRSGYGLMGFSITLDEHSGDLTINAWSGFSPTYANDQMFIGVTPGAGATDHGASSWAPGFNAGPPLGTDMNYMYGTAGTLLTGVSVLTFHANGHGYDVIGS